MELSIVVPIYNEINRIKEFTNRIRDVFKNEDVEYIFVNDGSNDGSAEWLSDYFSTLQKNKYKYISLSKNKGKGFALRQGLKLVKGDYILFLDSDLEYDPVDTLEMFNIIKADSSMKVLFGSRFVSGKLKSRKYLLNEIAGKVNSLIFNLLFKQSINDIHSGTKIIAKEVFQKIILTVNDFGFEIDIASQISKNNYKIYEYGISYIARTYKEGKKITWKDGLLSYYYLFKSRFIDNEPAVLISIIYSAFYMGFVGSYFGMGIGKYFFIFFFILIGLFIGLYKKLATSSIIFLLIYFGSFFSKGNGRIYIIILFFLLSLYLSKKLSLRINKMTRNKFIRFFA